MSEELKFFGKYETLEEGRPRRKLWIGPLTENEMNCHFPEFRHNITSNLLSTRPTEPQQVDLSEAIEEIDKIIETSTRFVNDKEIKNYAGVGIMGYELARIKSILEKGTPQQDWINVSKKFPSRDNGYVDELVLIRVKNKNKPDGIWLYDVCVFDGESWCDRLHTWETIVEWKPIEEAPQQVNQGSEWVSFDKYNGEIIQFCHNGESEPFYALWLNDGEDSDIVKVHYHGEDTIELKTCLGHFVSGREPDYIMSVESMEGTLPQPPTNTEEEVTND